MSTSKINSDNVDPNLQIGDTENTSACVRGSTGPSTNVNESRLGTNLANASNSTPRKVSTTLVSSFGFNEKEAGAVEKLMTDFCSQARSLKLENMFQTPKIESSLLDNLKTLFAKIVDFFKGNHAEIEKRQAEGWKQFESFKALFGENSQSAQNLRNDVLLPTFKNGTIDEQIALMKMFHDKPRILFSFKDTINDLYQRMGAVNFYNAFKDHILNNEMPWLDKGFYVDPTLNQIKAQMTPAEKDKFSIAAYTITKEQFRKGLEKQQLVFGGSVEKTEEIKKMVSFLSGEGDSSALENGNIVLLNDLIRKDQCSIKIGNAEIELPHSSEEKKVTVKEILENLRKQVQEKALDKNAIEILSEFLIKTLSQGYLAAALLSDDGQIMGNAMCNQGERSEGFTLEVVLGDNSSVRVKQKGITGISFGDMPNIATVRRDCDYTLNLDPNDLSQVKSVQINEYKQEILGIETA